MIYNIDYVWTDIDGECRTKRRFIALDNLNFINEQGYFIDNNILNKLESTYDGSSTGQARLTSSDSVLYPIRIYKGFDDNHLFLLCDTETNKKVSEFNDKLSNRAKLNVFPKKDILVGFEQEYYFMDKNTNEIFKTKKSLICHHDNAYCSVGKNSFLREIVDEHSNACLKLGIHIYGTNSEVSTSQWEFQIGTCDPITACDDLIMARFLLNYIANTYNLYASFHPKPDKTLSGSGCHINISTDKTRNDKAGLTFIEEYINKLIARHDNDIKYLGKDNEQRLTGFFETSNYNIANYGFMSRNTSFRIPYKTYENKCGYFEDRRPAANIDPYVALNKLFESMFY